MERQPQCRHGSLSRITAAVKEQLRDWVREKPGLALAELGERLRAQGTAVSRSRVSQILHQIALGVKKVTSRLERETEASRKRWKELLATVAMIAPEKLKFLDQSGVTRMWGSSPRSERVTEATPDGRWQVLTTLGTMSLRSMEAVMTAPGAHRRGCLPRLRGTSAVCYAAAQRRADPR